MGLPISKFLDEIFKPKETKVLLLGLDGVGKATIFNQIEPHKVNTSTAKNIFEGVLESIKYKDIKFISWDLRADRFCRFRWKSLYHHTHGIIFVVDSNDKERLGNIRGKISMPAGRERFKGPSSSDFCK